MRVMGRGLLYGLLGLVLTLFVGCSGGHADVAQTPSSGEQPAAVAPATQPDNIKFKREDGSELFSLEFRSDGAKLEAAGGEELARLTVDGSNKVKIKDASDATLGYIVSDTDKWKVENAAQTEELYILRRQTDGDYTFETGADQDVYRIKQRDYGFEIETPDKVSRYKIKLDNGKLSLRDASETTVLYTNDPLPAIALVPFGLDELTPEQQVGLTYALSSPMQNHSDNRGQSPLLSCAELSCTRLGMES